MFVHSVDWAFREFQRSGDARALAFVFDATAPELQRLARFLAGPEAPAEDLLQATYLSAIESKQRFDATQRVLPWLVGILVNHAREARRRGRRQIDRENLRGDVALDPSDEASAAELSQTLDQAISRLPEAQRAVLRLYLQHGLEPAEIARSLERPPGTVRAQLGRGLKRLRRFLPRSIVASQAYALVSTSRLAEIRATVLGKTSRASIPVASSALLLGFMAMSLNKKILLAAGVLLALLLSYTFHGELRFEAPAKSDGNVVRAEAEPAAADPVASSEALQVNRTRVPLAAGATVAEPEQEIATGSLLVHVTCDDRPLARLGVALHSLARLGPNSGTLLDFVPTDADGNAIFDSLQPARFIAEVDRATSVGVSEVVAGQQQRLEIRLRGLLVVGSVVDGRGAPVSDATIWAHGIRLDAVELARTDSRGAFSIEHVSPFIELQARKPGFAASMAHPVKGNEGESWQVQLTLAGEASEVSGRVLDPNGFPAAGALVAFALDDVDSAASTFPTQPQPRAVHVRADAAGLFRIREVPRGAVVATAVGPNPLWTPALASIDVGLDAQRVEFQLGMGATIEGRITKNGAPWARCGVTVKSSPPDAHRSYQFDQLAERSGTSDAQGEFRIVGILPGEVQMRAQYKMSEVIGQQTIRLAAGETRRWDLDGTASVRVPFDIAIEPRNSPVERDKWLVCVWSGEESGPSFLSQSVDSNGSAHFTGLSDAHYTAAVYCQPEMGDLILVQTAEFDAREKRLSLQVPAERLRLKPVRGCLIDASGVALSDRTVRVRSSEATEGITAQRATGKDGKFSFAGLPAGRYAISLVEGAATRLLREFTVAGDRAEDLGDITVP